MSAPPVSSGPVRPPGPQRAAHHQTPPVMSSRWVGLSRAAMSASTPKAACQPSPRPRPRRTGPAEAREPPAARWGGGIAPTSGALTVPHEPWRPRRRTRSTGPVPRRKNVSGLFWLCDQPSRKSPTIIQGRRRRPRPTRVARGVRRGRECHAIRLTSTPPADGVSVGVVLAQERERLGRGPVAGAGARAGPGLLDGVAARPRAATTARSPGPDRGSNHSSRRRRNPLWTVSVHEP